MSKHVFKKLAGLTASILIIFISYSIVTSNSAQAPLYYTGDPATALVCANQGCHGGGLINVGPGNISISSTAPNSIYTIDSTYTISYSVNESGKIKFGFESVVLNSSLNAIGTFSVINAANTFTATGSSSGRLYVGHLNASGNKTWTVKWKAPHTYGGPATFYACGNAANGNGNADAGDNIYKSTLVLNPSIASGISSLTDDQSQFNIFPNPANSFINLDFSNIQSDINSIEIFNTEMKNVSSVKPEILNGSIHSTIDLNELPSGIYFVKINSGNDQLIKKIFISK